MSKLYQQIVNRCPECPNCHFNPEGDHAIGFDYNYKLGIYEAYVCWHDNFKNGKIICSDVTISEFEKRVERYKRLILDYEKSLTTLFPLEKPEEFTEQHPIDIIPDWCPLLTANSIKP